MSTLPPQPRSRPHNTPPAPNFSPSTRVNGGSRPGTQTRPQRISDVRPAPPAVPHLDSAPDWSNDTVQRPKSTAKPVSQQTSSQPLNKPKKTPAYITDGDKVQGKKDSNISMVLGIISILVMLTTPVATWISALLSLVISIVGLVWAKKAKQNDEPATFGTISSWIIIGLSIAMLILFALIALAIIAGFSIFAAFAG